MRVSITRGEVRMALGGEDPNTVENADGFVDLDDGTTRTFAVLTLAEVDRLMKKWELSGESLSGAHLRVRDLVLLREGGISSIVAAVDDSADELPVIELDDGRDRTPDVEDVLCPACGASARASTDPQHLDRSVCYCGHPRYYDYKHLDGTCPCLNERRV